MRALTTAHPAQHLHRTGRQPYPAFTHLTGRHPTVARASFLFPDPAPAAELVDRAAS
ncbi:hypothetical protein ACFV3E_37060 [Streptomyces sp. NPDC059718]